ncbi:MAG TPA: phosphoribosylglycinamide formyltransferase [Candidatus Saccharicenans sp.]|jgi:phosphoribosylglycinamide formyltransferase-1|nr:phosphoribosylglycinamide formyltransferase [Candidatus Saccharicenans sp.]HRD02272.1 phosphoribosylglycinamide formyltransferase [Candidatus Saccharicenans sp.]
MAEEKIFRSPKKRGRVGVLLSGRGSNFRAIHDAMSQGKINADIVVVISNRAEAPGLQTARERGLETLFLDPKAYPSKEAYDEASVSELKKREVDLVCLAGYMKIVTPLFCQAFRHQIMNIHPALLPSFPGLHAQKQAVDYGVRYSGATVHFVSEEVDGGPIILQAVVPVYQDDTEETLANRILVWEHKIYPEAVHLYFEGRLEVRGRKVYILD